MKTSQPNGAQHYAPDNCGKRRQLFVGALMGRREKPLLSQLLDLILQQ